MWLVVKDEGGKKTLKKITIAIVLIGVAIVIVVCLLIFKKKEDTSYFEKSDKKITLKLVPKQEEGANKNKALGFIADYRTNNEVKTSQKQSGQSSVKINYNAKQIIERSDANTDKKLPIGSSFIGKLLTGIDTREPNQFIKVVLPYGASFQRERRLERNSIIFGTINYPGKGEKIYMSFSRGVMPNGNEFMLQAQALNPADYSPGLIGDYHGKSDIRIATTLGLHMLGSMGEVLTEKESLGDSMMPTPKSNMKNAFYYGASNAANEEATRQAEELRSTEAYVTVESGTELVIQLIETYKGGTN